MNAGGEVIDGSLLATKIEDANLRVGNTTVEPGLGVRLERGICQYTVVSSMPRFFFPFHHRADFDIPNRESMRPPNFVETVD